MSKQNGVDVEWLCAAAEFEFGTGSVEAVVEASLNWLPTALTSQSLFELADHPLDRSARRDDVHPLIIDVFSDLGLAPPSADDFRWMAILSFLLHETSVDPRRAATFLARVASRSPADFDLLGRFLADVDYIDDGVGLDRIDEKIREELNQVREPLRKRSIDHFEKLPGTRWVLGVFGMR
jgi:hypothetical protein